MAEITTLNTAFVNVNSLVSIGKRVQFANFLKKHKPHIVLISETHLKNKHKVNFSGYKIFRTDREVTGCGGTAVCVSDKIKCEQLNNPNEMKSLESCSVKIITMNTPIIFTAIYRRPISKIEVSDLNKIINIDKDAKYVICGDFNSHSPLWGSSSFCSNGKVLSNWLNDNKVNLKIQVRHSKEPTCSVSLSGSYIDFAILSEDFNVTNADADSKLPSCNIFSDHSLIFLNLDCDPLALSEPVKIKIYKKTNWKKFNGFIDKKISELNIPLDSNMSPQAIDDICARIEGIFIEAVQVFVPEVEITNADVELSAKSLSLLREKKRLMRRKHRNRNNHNFPQIQSQLVMLNKLLVQSISDDYRQWWTARIKNIKPDNNLFKNIKRISSYGKSNRTANVLYNEDKSENFRDDKSKCEALAKQFAKSHQLSHTSESNIESEVDRVNQLYENSEPIIHFTPEFPADFKQRNDILADVNISRKFSSVADIQSIIKSRKSKKSSGIDSMPNYALKKLSVSTIYWITVLFNHITNTQHYPSNWKTAAVTSIPKPGKNIEFLINWRPISQLPTLSKCYEKVMDLKIRSFCDRINLLDNFQFGFQPGNSTLHAISKFITDISNGLNNGAPTLATLIDLQSAFDVIWHNGLIYKLHQMNFEPDLIRIVKSFLQGRKFFVTYGQEKSSTKSVAAGTPQGSIVSAILFILYLNDLPKPSSFFCKISRILFADDIIVYTVTKNIHFAALSMNNYLNEIHKYFVKWKLKMNVKKCESISFVGHYKDINKKIRQMAKSVKFKINGRTIKNVKSVKYLGLVLSSNFQFVDHVKHVIKKINAAQQLLSNIFLSKFVNSSVKIIAYKQLIRPLMKYASPCWLIKNLISSYQVELLRRKERWFLRKCLNVFKQENSHKFIASKDLYEAAGMNRIDKELIKDSVSYVEKAMNHEKEIISQLFLPHANDGEMDSIKYKPIRYFNYLKDNDRLNENGLCLIFNKKKFQPDQSVYTESQNVIDF